ncbi:hypothetical protein [Maribacter sp. 2210JD10-5]|uniref:hypothetical protein n=1 Tax=Maribacter sp. 2210JD10-5 TaxID=3386272 RepID=UPI0039BD7032
MIPKTYAEFEETLNLEKPPNTWPDALKCTWFDAKGDWESAHNIAQDMHNQMGSWLHAYLHRKEGDRFNAGYWYRQAGKPYPEVSLKQELEEIVNHIIQ